MLIACSLTGVDRWTDLDEVAYLGAEYPFAEFAILYSKSRAGQDNRYPSRITIETFAAHARKHGYKSAIHICGSAVDDFVRGEADITALARDFERIQLNFSAKSMIFTIDDLSAAIERFPGKVITQHNLVNCIVSRDVHAQNHQVLFDASLGRGVAERYWDELIEGKVCGYAGGISADNIQTVLDTLSDIILNGPNDIWIDMESGVRDAGDRFDLKACLKVLETVAFNQPISRAPIKPLEQKIADAVDAAIWG